MSIDSEAADSSEKSSEKSQHADELFNRPFVNELSSVKTQDDDPLEEFDENDFDDDFDDDFEEEVEEEPVEDSFDAGLLDEFEGAEDDD